MQSIPPPKEDEEAMMLQAERNGMGSSEGKRDGIDEGMDSLSTIASH